MASNYVFLALIVIASAVPFCAAAEAKERFELTYGRSQNDGYYLAPKKTIILRNMLTITFTHDDTTCMNEDTCDENTECSLPQCMCITKINPDAHPFCISNDCTGKPCVNGLNECVYPGCTCNTDVPEGEDPHCLPEPEPEVI